MVEADLPLEHAEYVSLTHSVLDYTIRRLRYNLADFGLRLSHNAESLVVIQELNGEEYYYVFDASILLLNFGERPNDAVFLIVDIINRRRDIPALQMINRSIAKSRKANSHAA